MTQKTFFISCEHLPGRSTLVYNPMNIGFTIQNLVVTNDLLMQQSFVDKAFSEYSDWLNGLSASNKLALTSGELPELSKVVFVENLKKIAAQNSLNTDLKFGVTPFTHLTSSQFAKLLNFHSSGRQSIGSRPDASDFRVNTGDSFDLGECNLPVRNQGQCGSCWAFATAGALESSYCHASSEALHLSEQALVDCDSSQLGCNGAYSLLEPLQWVEGKGGLPLESDYTYAGENQRCRITKDTKFYAKPSRVVDLDGADFNTIAEHIKNHGGVSVGVNANAFQFYSSGVLDKEACGEGGLNHAVLAVGYEKTNNKDILKIKNSWSAHWGEEGYVRVEYDACGLGSMGSAFTFEKKVNDVILQRI